MKLFSDRRFVWASLAVLLLLTVAAGAESLAPYDPDLQAFVPLDSPSWMHIAGTDRFGRDLFSRILVGLQTSVLSTLVLVVAVTSIGTATGVLCGYRGGVLDAVLMRVSDVVLAFPGLVFALAVAAVLGGGLQNAVLALAFIGWPKYARIARSLTLAVRGSAYVDAAKLAGSSDGRILVRHVLPNALGPVFVTAVLDIGTMLMELAGLSFLGLGARPPTAELGNMMSAGRSMLQSSPWVVLAPGAAILLAVAIFNFFGDALRDALDPSTRARVEEYSK